MFRAFLFVFRRFRPHVAVVRIMDPLKGSANTTINAVKQATQYLEDCLKRDEEYPELWDFFGQTSSGQYSSGDVINIPQFFHKKWIVLPEALIEQYNCIQKQQIFQTNNPKILFML